MTTTKLSKSQHSLLAVIQIEVARNGGHAARSIFWRSNTLDALVRRGLIEVVGDEVTLTKKGGANLDQPRTEPDERKWADDRLRFFALNNFGDGQHPHADPDTLPFFKAPYLRACLLKCAASNKVMPKARERAADLAEALEPHS